MARSRSKVASRVSEALLLSETVGSAVFEVNDDHGVVTLRGAIESEQNKLAAEALARKQAGVVEVVNKLRVPRF